ncbi:Uncharacterised protein [Weissella viridescens]|uniref:Uncharacterized protein n=1 Tax=Weissella viridescens TaxID=1629 RepID=A0A380P8T8_WEIVI|nr:Uncharacterised protein [Weissella viridescens]
MITGDSHAYNVQFDQPMKFAAMEGISEDVGGKDNNNLGLLLLIPTLRRMRRNGLLMSHIYCQS